MRVLTNLGWPDTPFGSTGRPVQRPVQWLTGVSCQWADAGTGPMLMSAAAVLMPVHRTRSTPVTSQLAHYGFKVMAAETDQDRALLDMLDEFLIQARRQAQIIAWHSAMDDLHGLRGLSRSCQGHRHPGIAAVSEAWENREHRAAGTARCVDTALDLDPTLGIADASAAHRLTVADELLVLQHPTHAQLCYDILAEAGETALVTESLAAGALTQALMSTLLGGKATGRLHWEERDGCEGPLNLHELVGTVAWDQFPTLFTRTPSW
ncbi:hypothetical protein ABT391_07665 [Streptomyces jumonjinensis]|uniref:Uncharacterized protein n=1 Tax=Streptomyces jumonjinensis TaxID=1945 RepID=A0A646KC62_STRJU|nr:hypothetical protein [Streptomyces jumonjinensis]